MKKRKKPRKCRWSRIEIIMLITLILDLITKIHDLVK